VVIMPEPDRATVLRGLTPADPSLEQHEELVLCAERRLQRARSKLAVAVSEEEAAEAYLVSARAKRDRFVTDNPDPQLSILDAIAGA
jgi:hypothetical protein